MYKEITAKTPEEAIEKVKKSYNQNDYDAQNCITWLHELIYLRERERQLLNEIDTLKSRLNKIKEIL